MSEQQMELLTKINEAVAAANNAEQTVMTAQADLVSRSKQVGLLLLEAKKLHPKVKDFEAFLKRVKGLKLSRAYDLLRLAGGRTTDEEIRKDTRERVKKHREKKAKSFPKPEPELPATVTESAAESALRRKAEDADSYESSADCLAKFEAACQHFLPKLTRSDLERAKAYAAKAFAVFDHMNARAA